MARQVKDQIDVNFVDLSDEKTVAQTIEALQSLADQLVSKGFAPQKFVWNWDCASLTYLRDETPAEAKQRERDEINKRKLEEKNLEARRKKYEELKAEFEGAES